MLEDFGYSTLVADEAVFCKFEGDEYSIIAAAVDDLTLITNNMTRMRAIKDQLISRFEMSDLGEINWILGFEVK